MTLILKLMNFFCKMKYRLDLNHPHSELLHKVARRSTKNQEKTLREALCLLCVSLCNSLKRAESLVKGKLRVVVLWRKAKKIRQDFEQPLFLKPK